MKVRLICPYIFVIALFLFFAAPAYSQSVNTDSINAPFSDTISSSDYLVPLGWGIMDPSIILDNNNWYATLWYPCNHADKKIFCLKIVKNGVVQSPEHRLDAYTSHGSITHAYQPPILFFQDSSIFVAYWALSSQTNMIVVAKIPITDSGFGDRWQISGIYNQPDSFNYLGGALGPQKELVIAGWSHDVGLKILKSYPPYTIWQQTFTSEMQSKNALYSHVAIGSDSRIGILSVEGPYSQKCIDVDKILTNYKNVHYYEGDFSALSSSFKTSDSSPDYINYSNFNLCAWRNLRFPQDLFYDSSKDRFLYIIQRSNLNFPYSSYASNNSFTQTYTLSSSDNSVFVADLSVYFSSLNIDGNSFDGFRVSRIRNGEYAVIGSSIKNKIVSIVFTTDFVSFSTPQVIDLTTLSAYSDLDYNQASYVRVHVFQPNKNTADDIVPEHVHIWFAPFTYNQPNYWLRYTYAKVSSNLNSRSENKFADTNNDNKVDGVDYIIWLNNYNMPVSGIANGNFDGNNKVDGVDYIIWLNNYNK